MAKSERKTVKAEKLLEAIPAAIMEGGSIRQAALDAGLSQKGATFLAHAIDIPMDELNKRIADKLTQISLKYLDRIDRECENMPLNSLAYTGLMLLDKRSNLLGRTNPAGTQVNLQINNHGSGLSKAELMDLLEGKKRPQTADPATITPPEDQNAPNATEPPPDGQ